MVWEESGRGQGRVKEMSGKGQGRIKEESRRGQGEARDGSRKGQEGIREGSARAPTNRPLISDFKFQNSDFRLHVYVRPCPHPPKSHI